MKKILTIITMLISISACSEKVEVDPETLADCIAIENPNDRDICKMKLQQKAAENSRKALGNGEINHIDF